LAILFATSAAAKGDNWVPVGPFGDKTATALLWDSFLGGTYLYAAIDGVGVFRSTNLGGTFDAAGSGLTNTHVAAMALEHVTLPSPSGCPPPCSGPGIVYAATPGGGVFVLRSDRWTAENSGLTDLTVNALASDPTGVWAGTAGGGLFRNVFAAAGPTTWRRIDAPSDGTPIHALAVTPDGSTVFFGTDTGLYRSRDAGTTWSRLQQSTLFFLGAVRSIVVDPGRPGTVYAAGIQDCRGCGAPAVPAILKSVDAGETWTGITFGIGNPIANVLLVTETSDVFAGTAGGVFRSVDGGASWSGVGLDGIAVDALIETPFPFSESVPLAAGTVGSGVFRASLPIGGCHLDETTLCLRGGRFSVRVQWRTSRGGGGEGSGRTIPLSLDSGAFWFFQASNVELVVKVLDGRAINGHFWVFFGALSDVAYTITVTDAATGASRRYENAEGTLASRADTEAF